MRKNVLASLCAAVLVVAIIVPAALSLRLVPEAVISGDVATQVNDSPASNAPSDQGTAPDDLPDAVEPEPTGDGPSPEPEYEPGVMLVGLADGVTVDQFNERLASLDYVATKQVSEDDLMFGYVLLDLAEGVAVDDAVNRIQGESVVKGAEPDYVFYVQDESPEDAAYAASNLEVGDINDEGLIAQAETVISDTYQDEQWALDAVHAYDAWDVCKAQDASPRKIVVAVLDSGMNVNHADFVSTPTRIIRPYSYISNSTDVTDTFGHGTHVAGIIAATTNNNEGIAGVSYNAQIMPVQVIKSDGATSQSLIMQGLQYVVTQSRFYNVKVVNISIGSESEWSASSTSQALLDAMAAVHQKGILVVYAAGNYANSIGRAYDSFPCDFDDDDGAIGVISVAKNGTSYVRSSFSNYNKGNARTKEISAPGSSILSTTIDNDPKMKDSDYLADTEKQYGYKSGTSMAAPYVSGIAALLFANDKGITAADVRDRICETANDFDGGGWNATTGYGLIDAQAALLSTVKNTNVTIANIPDQTYDGEEKTPVLTVTMNGDALTAGDDYRVVYTNNTDAGTATAKVILIGDHAGEGYSSTTFTINPKPLTGATVQVEDQTYSGAALKPVPTVTLGATTLDYGADYTVSYSANTNAGTATATVNGAGNYTGSVPKNFTINKAKLSFMALSQSSVTYNGADQKPTCKVYGPKNGSQNQLLLQGADYNLTSSGSHKDAGTYEYVAEGNGSNYTTDTVSAKFTINKLNLSSATVTLGSSSYTYDGTAKAPVVTVKSGSNTLKGGADYKATYYNNVNAGTAGSVGGPYVSVTAMGSNCTGSTTRTFTINKAALSSMTLSQSSYTYDGASKNPTVVVYGPKDGRTGQVLSAATDYTVSPPSGRVEVGTYTYRVSGKGNYTGTKTASFSIQKSSAAQERLAGNTALDTMRSIVNKGWSGKKGGVVVLTTVDGYWDALTAAGIAGKASAPVLMTNGWSLSDATRSAIRDLAPSTIVICGGESAVSGSVEREAQEAAGGAKIVRCAGTTATGTAIDAFQKGKSVGSGSWSSTAFVCTNDGYWDALAAAPISYARAMPIFLTEGRSSISGATLAAMKGGGIKQVYIVGGSAAVGPEVAEMIRASGIAVADRLWGDTAVETSERVANFGLSQHMTCNYIGVATTNGYWDALAGAPLCGLKNSVLVLARDAGSHSISSFISAHKSGIIDCYVFGGEAAIDPETYRALRNALS